MWALKAKHKVSIMTRKSRIESYVNMFLAKTICENTFSTSITSNTRSLFPALDVVRYLWCDGCKSPSRMAQRRRPGGNRLGLCMFASSVLRIAINFSASRQSKMIKWKNKERPLPNSCLLYSLHLISNAGLFGRQQTILRQLSRRSPLLRIATSQRCAGLSLSRERAAILYHGNRRGKRSFCLRDGRGWRLSVIWKCIGGFDVSWSG